ncbi:ferredoxin [Desulfitispora alkaliphila]|uniref:4Fe-4S binding protein n=1 Tax=Desulfitispora alkaliphila TaxID=622674 RepID=UPI003D19AEED
MDLEKIVELVNSRMGPMAVEHKRCIKVKSPMSSCDKCLQNCPVDALKIDLEGKITFSDNCIECGHCAAACPTQALAIQEPTELNLLNRAEKLGKSGGTVVLGCKQHPVKGAESMLVPCLGALTPEFLLNLEMRSYPVYVTLDEENCAQCKMMSGQEKFQEAHKKALELKDLLVLPGTGLKVVEKVPTIKQPTGKKRARQVEVDEGRRNFFGSIFGGLKKAPQAAVDTIAEPFIEKGEEHPVITKMPEITTDRIKLLQNAVLQTGTKGEVPVPHITRPKSGENPCFFCRACATMCPVGALNCDEEAGELTHNTRDCTGCGLCTEICFHKSLELKPSLLSELGEKEKRVLFSGTKGTCESCGVQTTSSDQIEKCPICRKKEAENQVLSIEEE